MKSPGLDKVISLDFEARPLVRAYLIQRSALKQFLTVKLGRAEEAEDLVQEMYFRLSRETPPGSAQDLVAYLYRMALNLAHDRRRQRSRAEARDGQWLQSSWTMIGSEPIAPLPEPEAALTAKQRLAVIVAALNDLSPQCRRVFELHKFEGLSHSEIAARMGISRSTVEKHMGKALRHLIERVGS